MTNIKDRIEFEGKVGEELRGITNGITTRCMDCTLREEGACSGVGLRQGVISATLFRTDLVSSPQKFPCENIPGVTATRIPAPPKK